MLPGCAPRSARSSGWVFATCWKGPSRSIASGSRTHVSADVNLPRGMALSREVLNARLVEAAMEAGAEFRPGTTVKRDSPLLAQAPVVVIASGLSSNETSPRRSRIRTGVILPPALRRASTIPRTIHMATGRGGYVGLVRVEEDRLDIAAAFDADFVKSSGGLGLAAKAILRQVCWPIPSDLAECGGQRAHAQAGQRAARERQASSSSVMRLDTLNRSRAKGWPGP